MNFNCKIYIVDAIMGAGKTESMINYINNTDEDERILVITPYLDEIERYIKRCPNKKFTQPQFNGSTKIEDIKRLLSKGRNIISTHALFQKFNNEIIDLCRAMNYTLIMDEVANVVEEKYISPEDFDILMQMTNIDPDTKQLIWKEEYSSYKGKFDDEKRLCELGSLVVYGNNLMIWLFPVEAFNAFRKVYILTYMFKSQLQCYYYDYYGLPYEFLSVEGEYGNHRLIDGKHIENRKYNYNELIHILDNEKMNNIGDRTNDLCKTWYERNKDNSSMKVLKNNIYNFFFNIRKSKSSDNLWTTFKDYKTKLQGKGYTKGFLASNARATNEYRERINVAYTVNKFINPFVKNFFNSNGIKIDEDGYALSEMLQFIWRSAIRDGKEIWVYIPSIRMRKLLNEWINYKN